MAAVAPVVAQIGAGAGATSLLIAQTLDRCGAPQPVSMCDRLLRRCGLMVVDIRPRDDPGDDMLAPSGLSRKV